MRSKFVSAIKPTDYADRLFVIQERLRKLSIEKKALEAEEKHLENYLIRFSKGQTFVYNSGDYQRVVKIGHHSRMILDQPKVLKLLKAKTPYTKSEWTSIKVDYVYETGE